MKKPLLLTLLFTIIALLSHAQNNSASATDPQPLNFLDLRKMKRAGSFAVSPDGQWILHTVNVPNWETAKDQTDIHLVSATDGISSHRQMTYTEEKSEKAPQWSKDGGFFAFLSDRDGDEDQLYLMRPDGGEARKITKAKEGVVNYEFSPDGQWLVFKSGKPGHAQLYRLPADAPAGAEAEAITEQEAGVVLWEWAPDTASASILPAPMRPTRTTKPVRRRGFTVNVKNYETPLNSLWCWNTGTGKSDRLTEDDTYTVSGFVVSDDSKWVGYTGTSAARYERNITEQRINADLFLMKTADGSIERLTDNEEVGESGPYFSPDGNSLAFVASADMSGYNMRSRKVYIRDINETGGAFRQLGGKYDGHVGLDFWSADGKTIYFNSGVKATRQLLALDVEKNAVRQLTTKPASLRVSKDKDSGTLLINYSDAQTPSALFTTSTIDKIDDRSSWTQLTDLHPQLQSLALGEQKEISYRSTDGKEVGGVLVLPVDYQEGQSYPLVVIIHGGPAGAYLLNFNPGGASQVYAGAGYAVFCPNYRGSINYGEQHRIDIVGNYFPQAFDDIMAGVDFLISEGIADENRMGVFGWSAGGHWSNWILTHTDRFKAISSGAGTMNWISMYAQSDVQRNRQYYLGNDLPYDNFDAYWDQSPLKYIKNAKTPTMVHVVEGDPRVPSPQSVELHMALKKLGVDTELFMYPGRSHGIPDTRNRLVKSVSEMAWMDYYVRGIGKKFAWRQVLETLEVEEKKEKQEGTEAQDDGR